MKKVFALLLALLLFCSAALAEGILEAPYAPDTAGAMMAAAVADTLGMELHLTEDADPVKAAEVMLQSPGTLLCADQSLLIASLQGYTSQDLRTAMRPVVRIAVSPLYLVVNAAVTEDLGITDAESLLSYIAEHEYELYLARHIDADVVDRAVVRLAETVPAFTEGYPEDEIAAALESGEVLATVLTAEQIADADPALRPLCSLGAERTEAFPSLPCAAELGLPVCEGVCLWLFTASETDDAMIDAAALACLGMDPAAVNAVPGFSFAPLAGGDANEKIREMITDYIGYMTSEGLFFYEE